MGSRWQRFYFDRVYAPAYDLTVAQLAPYRRLLNSTLGRLSLREGHSVLSVGTGTGNELVGLLERSGRANLFVVAVDLSRPSLARARRKTRDSGNGVQLLQMDAQRLGFVSGRFDRVICLHTMDFLEDTFAATREIIRVLRKGGEFVVSYPWGKGSTGLVSEVGQSVLGKLRHGRTLAALKEAIAGIGAALAYLPLALTTSAGDTSYSRSRIERLLTSAGIREYTIEEEHVYQDYIVWGVK